MALKKDPVKMTLLFDYYGGTLTPKQSEVYESYYCADLSLTEIAENLDITRQGVHDLLTRGEKTLLGLEESLGFVARFEVHKERTEQLANILQEMDTLNRQGRLSSLQVDEYIKQIRSATTELAGE